MAAAQTARERLRLMLDEYIEEALPEEAKFLRRREIDVRQYATDRERRDANARKSQEARLRNMVLVKESPPKVETPKTESRIKPSDNFTKLMRLAQSDEVRDYIHLSANEQRAIQVFLGVESRRKRN